MARKVFVSSGISQDEVIVEIAEENPSAALLWPWILTIFDDWGRAEYSPRSIKYSVFPAISTVKSADIEQALTLFRDKGLIQIYAIDTKYYMAVYPEKWFKHQTHIPRIKRFKDESKLPASPAWGQWMQLSGTVLDGEAEENTEIAENREESLKIANNRAISRNGRRTRGSSPSLSPTPEILSEEIPPNPPSGEEARVFSRAKINAPTYRTDDFIWLWENYQKTDDPEGCKKKWMEKKPNEDEIIDIRRVVTALPVLPPDGKRKLPGLTVFLNQRRWAAADPFPGLGIYYEEQAKIVKQQSGAGQPGQQQFHVETRPAKIGMMGGPR